MYPRDGNIDSTIQAYLNDHQRSKHMATSDQNSKLEDKLYAFWLRCGYVLLGGLGVLIFSGMLKVLGMMWMGR